MNTLVRTLLMIGLLVGSIALAYWLISLLTGTPKVAV
jgi:hypothetical protein